MPTVSSAKSIVTGLIGAERRKAIAKHGQLKGMQGGRWQRILREEAEEVCYEMDLMLKLPLSADRNAVRDRLLTELAQVAQLVLRMMFLLVMRREEKE